MPWLNWGAASRNPLYCTFYMVWFSARYRSRRVRCKVCAVPGGKACLLLFLFFKRPLLQNYIMHSSICTNGYFCHVTLTSMLGMQLERPVLSQSDTTYRGRPHSQPICCDQCTFHTFDPKLRFNYSWMDEMTSKSTRHFPHLWIKKKKKKSSIPGLSPNEWGDKGLMRNKAEQ